ncbi:universal stress protein, partial [Wenyingzhuangia sp. 1_MG-2023]|nr:universal stress protein [Wenyingzhuangia sp. 1_MG-2023]
LLALLRNLMPATLHYSSRVRRGVVHQKILEEAGSRYADIIVMMAQKPGQGRYSIGSNAERVVRHAKCSVMVVREG